MRSCRDRGDRGRVGVTAIFDVQENVIFAIILDVVPAVIRLDLSPFCICYPVCRLAGVVVGVVVHVPVGDPEYPSFGKLPVREEFGIDGTAVPDTNRSKVCVDQSPVDLPIELAYVNSANRKISKF